MFLPGGLGAPASESPLGSFEPVARRGLFYCLLTSEGLIAVVPKILRGHKRILKQKNLVAGTAIEHLGMRNLTPYTEENVLGEPDVCLPILPL
jgi:hypothetical protein